jgi:uncharacterized membrane protein YraQ (UPF0718 family)
VLGPIFAVARPIGALVSAIVAGILVNAVDKEDEHVAEVEATCGSCCSKKSAVVQEEPALNKRLVSAVQYGYGRMISDTAKWLAIGLVAAAVITALVPQSFFLQWGDGVMAMIIMVIVGLPMYICATASTPVAASLLFAGISPGAALVFMLTGPATNLATMGVIREQLGLKSLGAYLIAVIGTAVTAGLLLNAAYDAFAWPLQLSMAEHSDSYPLWRQLAAIVLVGLIARVWVQPLFLNRGKLDQSAEPQAIEQS